MVVTMHGAEGSGSGPSKTNLRDWIAAEVSRAILEVLPSLVDRLTSRLIVRIEERIAAARVVGERTEVTQGWGPISETQLGKRKRTQEPASLVTAGKLNAADTSIDGQGNFVICGKCGGNHGYACHKFHCRKCKQKGHVRRDCPQVEETCNQCRQIGHIRANCPSSTGGAEQAPISTPVHEVKVEPQDKAGRCSLPTYALLLDL